VSALSDPNPNVYDVYVFNDYIKSGSTEYRISSTGQEYLKRGWHDASISCWDGSAAPCEGEQDHPYLINAHVYSTQGAGLPVTRHDFVDGVFGEELGGGRVWVRAYFNQFLKPEFKYTGVGIYTLGNFDGGGQATVSGRSLTWGLASVTDGGERRQTDVLLALSHEIGHCLGIEDLTTKKSGYPPESSVICRELYNPSTEEERFGAVPQNPMIPSLMNYGYTRYGLGMRLKNSVLPSDGDGYLKDCKDEHLRFSKGILGSIREAPLKEINPISGAPTHSWQDRMLVREMECFADPGRIPADPLDLPYRFNPYCQETECRVNWDYERWFNTTPPFPEDGPYAFDLSMGNYLAEGEPFRYPFNQLDCIDDILSDRNDLGIIQTDGKKALDTTFYTSFHIYKATFNGSNTENLAGWNIPKTDTNVSFVTPVYPMNQCYLGSDCASGDCRRDECDENSDCLSTVCGAGGVCSCTSDSKCFSNTCLPTGVCFTGRGVCSCTNSDQCSEAVGDDPFCQAGLNVCWPRVQRSPVSKKAASFGSTGVSSIRLSNAGFTSPFVAITDSGVLSIRFDFSFDGASAAEGGQYIMTDGGSSNGNIYVYLARINDSEAYLKVNNSVVATVRAQQWYHTYIWSDQNNGTPQIRVAVAPWNNRTGSYLMQSDDCEQCEVQCGSATWSGNFTVSNDFLLGSHWTGFGPFKGLLDNLTIGNDVNANQIPECPEED